MRVVQHPLLIATFSIELCNPKRFDAILIGRGTFLAQESSVKFSCTDSDHVSAHWRQL